MRAGMKSLYDALCFMSSEHLLSEQRIFSDESANRRYCFRRFVAKIPSEAGLQDNAGRIQAW